MPVAHLEQHGLHVEGRDGLAVLLTHAEALAVQLHSAVEVVDGHADVIDPPEQGRAVY